MTIEACSRDAAISLVAAAVEKTAVISITSKDEPDVLFPANKAIEEILRLKFNDLTEAYDEEGIPYGRPLPGQKDFLGLRAFVDRIQCSRLIVHCWEGVSRSAAVALAIHQYRSGGDNLKTSERISPNPLVYALACRELGIRPVNTDHK